MKLPPALMMLVLKLPHRPLSALTMITSVLLSGPSGRCSSIGWIDAPTRNATLASTRCSWTARGRALMIRSCARRSFDAATIFIALVICCVFFTARMRRRRSIRDGISPPALRRCCPGSPDGRELAREFLQRLLERALDLVVELLLLGNPGEEIRMTCLDELVQLSLVLPDV